MEAVPTMRSLIWNNFLIVQKFVYLLKQRDLHRRLNLGTIKLPSHAVSLSCPVI